MFAIKNTKTGAFISKVGNGRLKSVEINICSTYRNVSAAKTMIHNLTYCKLGYEIDGKHYNETDNLEIVEVKLVEL
jgi:hypothetical protein